MARGAESKEKLFSRLQEIYPNAFWEDENKILRIPFIENGENIELKVSLTAAKNNLANDNGFIETPEAANNFKDMIEKDLTEPTQEEKDNVAALLKALNF